MVNTGYYKICIHWITARKLSMKLDVKGKLVKIALRWVVWMLNPICWEFTIFRLWENIRTVPGLIRFRLWRRYDADTLRGAMLLTVGTIKLTARLEGSKPWHHVVRRMVKTVTSYPRMDINFKRNGRKTITLRQTQEFNKPLRGAKKLTYGHLESNFVRWESGLTAFSINVETCVYVC